MYDKLLYEAETYLRKQNNAALPIKKVWEYVNAIAKKNKFDNADSVVDFECLLDADNRFEIVSANIDDDVVEETTDDDIFEHGEMDKLGFGGEQLVRLRKAGKNIDDDDLDDVGFAPHAIVEDEHTAAHSKKKKALPATKKNNHDVKQNGKKKTVSRTTAIKKGKRK